MSALASGRVLVTGADGFIGSHVVEALVRAGATVDATALYTSFGTAGWLDTLDPDVRPSVDVHFCDIRDQGRINDLVRGADMVLHLAALIAIPYSYEAPQSFVDTNVSGTLNVLEASRRHDVGKVVVTSTSEVYGTPDSVPIRTTHALRAQSPYAASKVAADQLAMAYAASFGLDVMILRPFNTYGPRQSLRAVIPTILAQMLAGREEIRLGSLHTRRDFTFVTDTAQGFVRALEATTAPGDIVQLGTGTAPTIGEIVDLCRAITGSTARIVEDAARVRPADSEVQVLLSDPSDADARIGWRPEVALADGLARTAAWVASSLPPTDVDRYHR